MDAGMVKRLSILTAVLLVALVSASASAQTALVYTNNYMAPTHAALTGPSGVFRLTTYITDGVTNYNLSGFTGFDVVAASQKDGVQYTTKRGERLTNVNNAVRWILPSMPAHTYTLIMTATNDMLSAVIGNHVLTVTPVPLVITNDVSVTVGGSTTTVENTTIVTTLVEIAEGAVSNSVTINITQVNTNIYRGDEFKTNLLENLDNVDAVDAPSISDVLMWNGEGWSNSVIGGGSGTLTNGTGTNGITVTVSGDTFEAKLPNPIASSDQFLRSDGESVFWSTDRWPLPEIGTNYVIFDYLTDAPQDWVVPSGVSNVQVTVWGGGGSGASGGGGAGGGTTVAHPVTAGATVQVVCARGGQYQFATGYSPYLGGGLCLQNASYTIPGGGLSGAYLGDTNWICIGGGGGGGGAATGSYGGGGGGLSGGDSAQAFPALGGTQTLGGLGSQAQTNATMGAYIQGGATTNTGNVGVGAGGGGWRGGGAGAYSLVAYCSGGGGSGYISTNAIWGVTSRGQNGSGSAPAYPPFTDDPLYGAGIGVGGYNSSGGDGRVVIRW